MKLYYRHSIAALLIITLLSTSSCTLLPNNGKSVNVSSEFVGVWQNGTTINVQGHAPRISDTLIEAVKSDFLIIRNIPASKDSFEVTYQLLPPTIFITEDDNTIIHDFRPDMNSETRIRYIDPKHIIYDWKEEGNITGDVFTKLTK